MKTSRFQRRILLIVVFIFFGVFLVLPESGNSLNLVFKDRQFVFQSIRAMGYAATGAADIGECLSTVSRIKDGDLESWLTNWLETAQRLDKTASDFLAAGQKDSAREAFYRASNYYRTAGFFLVITPEDPRNNSLAGKARTTFLKGARLAEHPVRPVLIPYEGTTLPGYFSLVDSSSKKRPLLIVHSGFDGTAEELYFQVARLANKRGFNCLLFEGPGQGAVIHQQKLHFRPDWEKVVTPVVDYALDQPMVDPEKIALMGISLGGYLAPRAAAYEHRVSAYIANGGVYDFYRNVLNKMPPDSEKALDDPEASKEMDRDILEAGKKDVGVAWFFGNGMWRFGASSPTDLIRKLPPYSMREHVGKIRSTMLIVDSEGDDDMPGQAKQLYDALTSPKEFMLFTAMEGAEEHCQVGAIMLSNERILGWLTRFFAKR